MQRCCRNMGSKEGLISRDFLGGAGIDLHFLCVKRKGLFSKPGARNTQCSDLVNSQEQIDQRRPDAGLS
jgi:hypothetical protein